MRRVLVLMCFSMCFSACRPPALIPPGATSQLPPSHPPILVDVAPKEAPRLLPAEAYVRTYMQLFGAQTLLEAQQKAKGKDGNQLFDNWGDYLTTLGFPDHRNDLPRARETNALMIATFERLGIALCDRAVERDFHAPMAQRIIFAFDPIDPIDSSQFAERFDVLHRTFLGYPSKLAPPGRIDRYYKLYKDTQTKHAKTRLSPTEAAWSAVCQGLIRHPEFLLY